MCKLVFLNFSGFPIDAHITERIFAAIVTMRKAHHQSQVVVDPSKRCEGSVYETGKRVLLGSYRGDRFTAVIESDRGKSMLDFIIEDGMLELAGAFEIDVVDAPPAYRGASAADHASSAMWN